MTRTRAGLDPDLLDRLWDFQDPAGSERRFRRAIAESRRAEAVPETATAELTTQLARALGLQGRFAEAEALLDTVTPDRHPAVVGIRCLLERGRLRNSAGDPSAASPLFDAALDRATAAGADFLAADAAHMLAISDPARTAEWTARGLRIVAGSADPRCGRWAGALHNNLGWALREAGDHAGALAEFEAALAAYRAHGTPDQVRFAQEALDDCRRAAAG